MTLENTLRQQLSNPESGGFHFHADGWNITLAADKSDSLSCALKELTLDRNAPIQEELHVWAARIAEHATGLLEPLSLIEVDQPLGKALLRSQTPSVHGGKSYYYELVLERTSRTSANLRRFAGDRQNGEKREAVPFVLTHDTVVKLVTDIVGKN
jgi:hypothetical protein